MTIFGNDASKWQGDVNWSRVDASMEFGWEKVSEGPGKGVREGYVNEFWRSEKPEMLARARESGFIPGGYLFLAEGDGPRQADFFHAAAGDMAEFMIAVDVEPREATGSHPNMIQARSCVARLRALYPGHPIGGYIPHWYWGRQDTTFTDYLWASHYVENTGTAKQIYAHVPATYWAGYGGSAVSLLQFTDKATVPGVSGPSDCSAFRGSVAELRKLVLPRVAAAATRKDDPVHGLLVKGEGAVTPITLPKAGGRLVFCSNGDAKVTVRWAGGVKTDVALSYDIGRSGLKIPGGTLAAYVRRVDPGDNEVSYLVD